MELIPINLSLQSNIPNYSTSCSGCKFVGRYKDIDLYIHAGINSNKYYTYYKPKEWSPEDIPKIPRNSEEKILLKEIKKRNKTFAKLLI